MDQHSIIRKKTKNAKNLNIQPRIRDGSNQQRLKQRKRTFYMATWNVRGLGTKKTEVFKEIGNLNIDLCVLTETKKKGRGNEQTGEYIHFYTGVNKNERAKRGVSVAVKKKWKNNITSWEEVSDRIIMVELNIRGHIMVVIGTYAPTDDADLQIKDDFYAELTRVLSGISNRKEIFLLGDLNGRTGKQDDNCIVGKYGENNINDNGQRLIDLCENFSLKIMNGFFSHKMIHKFTWCQATRKLYSIIDYIIQRQKSNLRTIDVRVFRGAECGSDHFLVKASVEIKYRRQAQKMKEDQKKDSKRKVRYNLGSLRQDSVSFLYKMRLAYKLQNVRREKAEELYTDIKKCIHEAAKEAIGTEEKNRQNQPEWWNKDIEDLIKIKKCLYQKWLITKDREDRKLYARINREVKSTVSKLKTKLWEGKCEEVGRWMGGTQVKKAWSTIKNIRQDEKQKTNLQLISTQEWFQHYDKLFKEDRQEFKWNFKEKTEENGNFDVEKITLEEMEKSLNEMKNGKSPGPGDIPIELVKHGPIFLKEELTHLFNLLLENGQDVPKEWNAAQLFSIFKKGSRKRCTNYRGISVTSSIGRLYGRIIKKRIEAHLEDVEEQSGFRAGRSCLDNIFTLRQLIEKRMARNLGTHLLFVDLEKAYDSVPLAKLFEVLEDSSLNPAYVRCISNLYKNAVCYIINGRETSNQIEIKKGLKQGCSLSPTLFKVYAMEALKRWCRMCSNMGIQIDNGYLFHLLFADDQVIIANDAEDVSYMFRKLLDEYKKWGLKINLSKTEYISIGEESEDIHTEEGTVKLCKEFKYLGSYFTQDGKCDRDIRSRVTQGRTAIQRLNSLLWSSRINLTTKHKLYNAIIEPITTYASESWTITNANKKKLEAVEMDFLRRSCRVSRLEHIPNDIIRQRTNTTTPITEKVQQRQLQWYGHVRRMNDERWPIRLYDYYPERRRKRGRPSRTWKEEIQGAMEERGLTDDDWRDRNSWRLRCRIRRQM